jgi:DNA-binding GntR family transcriptional regulator
VAVELKTNDPRPYVRMAAGVRDRIATGDLKPGDPAPSIAQLSQQHGHVRNTCSKALQLLLEAGLLVRVPGFGYYVAEHAAARLAE